MRSFDWYFSWFKNSFLNSRSLSWSHLFLLSLVLCFFIIGSSIRTWRKNPILFASTWKHYHYRLTNSPSPPHWFIMPAQSYIKFLHIYGSVSGLFYSINVFSTTELIPYCFNYSFIRRLKTEASHYTHTHAHTHIHHTSFIFLFQKWLDPIFMQRNDMIWLIFLKRTTLTVVQRIIMTSERGENIARTMSLNRWKWMTTSENRKD